MRIRMDLQGPESWAEGLEGLIAVNRRDIRRGKIPPFPYKQGIRYQRETGTEDWLTGVQVKERGFGDCEDLAAWVVAGRRETGDPEAKAMMARTGRTTWHAVCRRGDGSIEDPTAILKAEVKQEQQQQQKQARKIMSGPLMGDAWPNLQVRVKRVPGGYASKVRLPLHVRRLVNELEEDEERTGWTSGSAYGRTKPHAIYAACQKVKQKNMPRLQNQAVYQAKAVGQMVRTPDDLMDLSGVVDNADYELGFLPALLAAIPSAVQALPGVLQQLQPIIAQVPQLLQAVPQTIKQLFGALPGFAQMMPGTTAAAPAAPAFPGFPAGLASLFTPAAPAAPAAGLAALLPQLLQTPGTTAAAPAAASPFAGLLKMIPGLSGYPAGYPVEVLGSPMYPTEVLGEIETTLGEFNLPPNLLFSLLAPAFGIPTPPPIPGMMPGFPGFPIPGLPQASPATAFLPPEAQMTMAVLQKFADIAKKPKGKKFLQKAKEKAKGIFKKFKLWGFTDLMD